MHCKPSLTSTTLAMFAVVALIAARGFSSRARAGRPTNSGNAPKTVTVVIRDFKFEPATLTLDAGDTVEWKNDDIVPHTATADGGGQKPEFDSGTIHTGAAWRSVTRNKGRYNYTCTLHPNMEGKLIVE